MSDYPQMIAPVDHVEAVPRRIRATLAGHTVVDTTKAIYVWEWPYYPEYYILLADVNPELLVDEQHPQRLHRGTAHLYGLRAGETVRSGAARHYGEEASGGLAGMVRFEWDVDSLRSTRHVRIELDGVILAESTSPVMVFETGLPTRYYLNRTEVNFDLLVPSDTLASCPYKGQTTGYWNIHIGDTTYPDLAWAYDFPTRQLLPIAGLVAFYNEKVDVTLEGEPLPRPTTRFFK